MVWLKNKKNTFQVRSLIWRPNSAQNLIDVHTDLIYIQKLLMSIFCIILGNLAAFLSSAFCRFEKKTSKIMSVGIQIRPSILLGLIWIQNAYKSYQHSADD